MNTPSASRRDWLAVVGLLVLCIVPVGAGIWRVHELASAPLVTADNARFVADSLPAVVHIISACLFCVLGAFQVTRAGRRLSMRWHRAAGRIVAPLGVVAGVAGVWLAFAYDSLSRDGPVLFTLRLASGTAMALFIVVAVVRVVAGDVKAHQAWMLRGYAIGIAAGTQFFTHLPWVARGVLPNQFETTCAMAAGWLINILVAEWLLRRRRTPSPSTMASTMASTTMRPAASAP